MEQKTNPLHLTAVLAGLPVALCLHRPQLARLFRACTVADAAPVATVTLTGADLAGYPADADPVQCEANELICKISDALLPMGRCAFHGVAFLWRGRAWLFTAPSGTGKTTQYGLWKQAFGGEISLLCGDKPFLEQRPDGTVMVHSSPWNGKENMGNPGCCPLGGILYLQQRKDNNLVPMDPAEAAAPLFAQMLFAAESATQVEQAAALLENLLKKYPVWLFGNTGDGTSARFAHDEILRWEEARL